MRCALVVMVLSAAVTTFACGASSCSAKSKTKRAVVMAVTKRNANSLCMREIALADQQDDLPENQLIKKAIPSLSPTRVSIVTNQRSGRVHNPWGVCGGWAVPVNNADLITVLQCEALFLECGGYRSSSSRWRPALLLEDSPSRPRGTSGCRCSEQPCPWLAFVAIKHQRDEIPCRQIVVGKHGETIEILYRTATPVEFEESFHTWLIETIDRLEHLAAQADEEGNKGATTPTYGT